MSDIQRQVQDTVDELVAAGTERGLQVCIYRHGEPIVDVVAGQDAVGNAIAPDTPVHAMSAGKGVAATVVHVLAEQGVLGYDTRVVEVWPEFGAHGKDAATVRQVLTHSVGVPALPAGTTVETMCDWDTMCGLIADAEPAWPPGTQTGYHAQTWGFIVGEIVRRATGRPISQVLREQVAGPLKVAGELYFGVPPAEHGRVARLEAAPGYTDMLAMFGSPVPPTAEHHNRADLLAADVPSGGVMSARAVARMYAALLGEVDGVRLVSPERLRRLSAVAYAGPDVVMGVPTMLALGYAFGWPGRYEEAAQTVFGMPGVGGSGACGDTATGIAFGLTTTRLHPGLAPALERIGGLVAASLG
jgi:CubicO group peptidase (beta-lactamase class C family)